ADIDLEATNIRGTLRSRKRIQSPLRQLFEGFRGQDDDTLHGHEPETEAFLDRIARPSPTVDFVAIWATALGFFCSLWALLTEVLSFDECRTNCSQYGSKIERVRQHWGVPEEEQDELYKRLPRICDALREIPMYLPWYKRFVAMFTESLLHHINKTEADIEKATYGAGANARTKQEIIQRTPPTMSLWRERYANIANDGTQFKQGIADTGKLVGNTKDKIQQVKAKTVEKKRDILRRWPLARRLGRYVGLLRHDPEELSKVTESIKALDQWYQELCIVQRLLMIAERNVDQLNKPLHDLAHNAWDKDVTFHHGDGMTKIQALYGGMKSRAREISRTASRDERTNDDEQE
ncbi:MAG: hypothetical protein Q9180_007047, partial [Flavoplaca navasiana]